MNDRFDSINVNGDSVEFDLAALVGRKVNAAKCSKIYARCQFDKPKLMEILQEEIINNIYNN